REVDGSVGDYEIGRRLRQFRRGRADAPEIARRPVPVDAQVLSLTPAKLRETLPKGGRARAPLGVVLGIGHHDGDAANAVALLRAPRERPRRRAAESQDELPPPHVLPSIRGFHPTTP